MAETEKPSIAFTPPYWNPKNYIFIPANENRSNDLYAAMYTSDYEADWYSAHKRLSQEGAFMSNLEEFLDFLNILVSEEPIFDGTGTRIDEELQTDIRKRILYRRTYPYAKMQKREWLDTQFVIENGIWVTHYNHEIIDDQVIWRASEPYSKAIEHLRLLPGRFGFHPPNFDGSVACFFTDNNNDGIDCNVAPSCRYKVRRFYTRW